MQHLKRNGWRVYLGRGVFFDLDVFIQCFGCVLQTEALIIVGKYIWYCALFSVRFVCITSNQIANGRYNISMSLGEWQQHQVTTLYNRSLKPQLRWSQFILATVLGHLAATNDVVYDYLYLNRSNCWMSLLGGQRNPVDRRRSELYIYIGFMWNRFLRNPI